ncbi:helicase SNF2 [Streptomyces tauricus]|uniref:DEAD/DEAH box helicase n=1 Tax=Streptomyces tauricus TaxID=68274 RepID=A0ABZ1JDS8_9ACTN|nr:DEAD/DEAH box helicase [Streptomyces tauricus]MCW8102466.1 DEAD/DEAH box helicase [Streptomyces tauricus]GHA13034.1 helicase SNF2 [Streptomyces tauricus]
MAEGERAAGGPVAVGRKAREVVARGERLGGLARNVLADHARALDQVRAALAPLLAELVAQELEGIPVSRLKDVTEGRLRLGALESAGFGSVRPVFEASRYELRQIPGVGAQTADQALAAARQIARALEETVSVRIDIDHPEPRTTALVIALRRIVEAGPDLRRAVDAAQGVQRQLAALLPAARPAGGRLRMALLGRAGRESALAAAGELRSLVADAVSKGVPMLLTQASTDLLRESSSDAEAWVDFELRSAEYYSQLAEIAGSAPDVEASEGFLPAEVADRVHAQGLDDTHRRVSLRGYQSFGARFALAQRRVVLGDEMGLGKTIQAIAVLAHLAADGHRHFLVVCPASVLINWTREIGSRSTLRAVPVHGPDRLDAYAEWRERGGVAVTTFDVLHTLPDPKKAEQHPLDAPAALVVDEAHYVKNPEARRSRAVARWTNRCERVLFLTGTPMENRVEEFRTLVRYLQPDLVPKIQGSDAVAGPHTFRRSVAPAYLRRNQQDVLTELPALVQVDEWEEFSAADEDAYREAVAAGNFMAMRRAAYVHAEKSAKLQRLRELVTEAAANELKVVVFSYFRDVLATVQRALGDAGVVLGPLAGGVPAVRRQQLVDEFADAAGHAVLLCQIEAGGIGLNLQAASVVILCEPQVKPTLEHQAVARAHRMGQVRSVQVHRLLATDSVDDRLLRILESKARLFDAYARRSDVAEASPDAVDVSDGAVARRIVEEEQERLALAGGGVSGAP